MAKGQYNAETRPRKGLAQYVFPKFNKFLNKKNNGAIYMHEKRKNNIIKKSRV
jgi:hypothetical protein